LSTPTSEEKRLAELYADQEIKKFERLLRTRKWGSIGKWDRSLLKTYIVHKELGTLDVETETPP